MTPSNGGESASGAASGKPLPIAREDVPGPSWPWSAVAALAVAGMAYVVGGASGEQVAQRTARSPSTEVARLEASKAASIRAPLPQPAAPVSAPVNSPAPSPAAPPDARSAAAPQVETAPPRASDGRERAVASAPARLQKRMRGSAHRGSRKRSVRTH